MKLTIIWFCLVSVILPSCKKDLELSPFEENEGYLLLPDNQTNSGYQLYVKSTSVPENGFVFLGDHAEEDYGSETFQGALKSYEVLSGFIPVTGNFDEFLEPNTFYIEAANVQLYQDKFTGTGSVKMYNYCDVFVYRIPIPDNAKTMAEVVLNEDAWEPIPVEWLDTTESWTFSDVELQCEVVKVNSIYVVARRID